VHEDSRESSENSIVVQLRNGDTETVGQRNHSLAVLEGFDTNAAFVLLEQEFREVVSFFNPHFCCIFLDCVCPP